MSNDAVEFGGAVRAQFLLLRRMGRVRMLIGAALLLVLYTAVGEWYIARNFTNVTTGGFGLITMLPLIVVLGAAWGIAAWWHEPPVRRDHILSAPVDVTSHELARIIAGAAWLMVMIGLTMLAALAIQIAAGRVEHLDNQAPAAWVSLISAPLLAYCLTATIGTATRRSIEFAIAGLVAVGAVYALAMHFLIRSGDAGHVFMLNAFSLFTALGGLGTQTSTSTTYAQNGATIEQYVVVHGSFIDPRWLHATLLWWGIAVTALVFVLWRRRLT